MTVAAKMAAKINIQCFTPALQELLAIAAEAAQSHGWQLYLVGGGVRDLLLATRDTPVILCDVDLVVDGGSSQAERAGMVLAEALQTLYPETQLTVHGKFQTAALQWMGHPVLGDLGMDIATARTESYAYPAANPAVQASSIQADLARRDFTLNALALRLTSPDVGEILDLFGGIDDLRLGQLRVLHAASLMDDPTRIYRGARLGTRLGFHFEAATAGYIQAAIARPVTAELWDAAGQPTGKIVPALQTRLKSELKYIFESDDWRATIDWLANLNALKCIHPSFAMTPRLRRELRLMAGWLNRFDPASPGGNWLMLLAVLLMGVGSEYRRNVAQNLQLPPDSIDRLANLDIVSTIVATQFSVRSRPSQIVELLKPYDLPMLLMLGVRSSQPQLRRLIRQYLQHWSQVKPILDGRDLQQLGYQPGKAFKPMLAALLVATLDGEVVDRDTAIAFLADRYPSNT
jgi:tRNA nucleotidyltransferase (CCA-adding enzyme)